MKPLLLLLMLTTCSLQAKVWYVVQGTSIPDPLTASLLAGDGDTVDIAYAFVPYVAYETKWPQHNLLIRGTGGKPILKAELFSVTQKAIFVTQGNDITIENIEFVNCKVPDFNGAGIRSEGVNLTVRHCIFKYNEMGILAGDKANCQILVEHCEFGLNGYGDGYSHNIYINHVQKFIFQHNYTHDSKVGHLIKSRAHETYILYNRLDSPQGYNPSREIDIPNGGLAIIIGNSIRQTLEAENSNLIGYGLEGLNNPGPHNVYIINNTLINEKANGNYVQFQAGTELLKMYNNIMAGGGTMFSGTIPSVLDTMANLRVSNISAVGFKDPNNLDYHLNTNSVAVNNGVIPGLAGTYDLTPTYEYVEVADKKTRTNYYPLDLGAFESELITITDNNITAKPDYISIKQNRISFINTPSNSYYKIYDLQGKLLQEGNINPDTEVQLIEQRPISNIISIYQKNQLLQSKIY